MEFEHQKDRIVEIVATEKTYSENAYSYTETAYLVIRADGKSKRTYAADEEMNEFMRTAVAMSVDENCTVYE